MSYNPAAIDQILHTAVQNHQAGRLDAASAIYHQILSQIPNHPEALQLLGTLTGQLGRLDKATSLLKQAIALEPNHAAWHCNLARFLKLQGNLDEAVAAARRAVALEPALAIAWHSLGYSLAAKAEHTESLACFQRALDLKADYPELHHDAGLAFLAAGENEKAIAHLRRAIYLNPNMASVHHDLAGALWVVGKVEEAVVACRESLRLRPNNADTLGTLGNVLNDLHRLDEAQAAFRQALAIDPAHAGALNNLANLLKETGNLDEAIATFRQTLAANAAQPRVHGNLLYTLHFSPQTRPQMLLREHQSWASLHAPHAPPAVHTPRDPHRRLRIGYVSGDFCNHPVAHFLLPLLQNHAFADAVCYCNVRHPDGMTARLRQSAHQWRDIAALSDSAAAAQIRADQIDILVDLAGHTGKNRLLIFAHKPAPIQVSWLGYPGTTGLPAINYRLTDSIADPPGVADAFHTERLWRLAVCNWCFSPPANSPSVLPRPAGRPVCFGSFNQLAKVTPEMMDLWAGILRAVPDSRLVIKARALASAPARQRLADFFAARGIAPARLGLLAWTPDLSHLAAWQEIDIALDTFPYHGTMTTCEALWMGVPVIALAGQSHVSRVGCSILAAAGRGEWAAETPQEYGKRAADLAQDAGGLAAVRATLRSQMQMSPLMDATRFAADMAAAFRLMTENERKLSNT